MVDEAILVTGITMYCMHDCYAYIHSDATCISFGSLMSQLVWVNRSCAEEVGHIQVRCLLYSSFHTFLNVLYSRQLNLIVPDKTVLVITTSIKIWRVTQGYLLQADIVSRDVHSITQYGPKCNCASRKQQNYSLKRKCHKNT